MIQNYLPPTYMRPYPEGSVARPGQEPHGPVGFISFPPGSTSYAEGILDIIHRDRLQRDELDFQHALAPYLDPNYGIAPYSGNPPYRPVTTSSGGKPLNNPYQERLLRSGPEDAPMRSGPKDAPSSGGMPLNNPYREQLLRSGPEDAPKRTRRDKTVEDDPYSKLPYDPYFKQLLKAIELEQSGQGDLGIGRETVPRTTGLAPGTGMSDYHQRNIDRLRNLSGDMVGAHAYRDAISGRRPAYEVTGDMSVSPYWRNRTYNETPTKTAQQRREQQSRYLDNYGGHQERKSFDTLDPEDPKAKAYMARKFREAGVKETTDYSELAYQDALDAKADAYNERRKKRRQRVADNIRPQRQPQTGTDRNQNRQRMALVPSERGRQAERADQRRQLMAEMFGNYRGY